MVPENIQIRSLERDPFGFVQSTSLDIRFFLSGSTLVLMLIIFRMLVKILVKLAKNQLALAFSLNWLFIGNVQYTAN